MSLIAADTHYLVVGLGVTGLSCVRYLRAQGKSVWVADSRQQPPGLAELKDEFADVPVYLGDFDPDLFKQASVLVMSPGVPLATPAVQQAQESGVRISSDVALFLEAFEGSVVAITGSNGKSTVTAWLGNVLKGCDVATIVAGNIGIPVLDTLSQPAEVAVLELSSFQLELIPKVSAKVATVLNVSEDHLDRYLSFAHYQQAKQRIYFGCELAVYNRDDALTQPLIADSVPRIRFGLGEPDLKDFGLRDSDGETYLCHGLKNLVSVNELPLAGRHNHLNALAVIACAHGLGIPVQNAVAQLQQFSGLKHRSERVATIDGVDYINDSKATNVGSTLAAIEGLSATSPNIWLLAGGQSKGQNLTPLSSAFQQYCKGVFAFGEDAKELGELANNVHCVADLETAFQEAKAQAKVGDIILLSPACASFDQFRNFEERGERFVSLVEGLA